MAKSTATGTASAGSRPGPDRGPTAANRLSAIGSRALAALLLFVLLVAPSCGELDAEEGNDVPSSRTASDAEINRAVGGGAATPKPKRTAPETTSGETSGPEAAGKGTASGSDADEPVSRQASAERAASFVHRATEENSRGDYTYLSHPRINGDPDAAVFAAPTAERGSDYAHTVGVWFEPEQRKWAIFNQDRAPVPAGETFEVVIPPEDERFVRRPGSGDTSGEGVYLDHPLVNGKPEARISVTQNWNPGGGVGVYNDHPVGVRYDPDRGRWEVFNEDDAVVPDDAAFNVTVSEAARSLGVDAVSVDTGEAPEYRDFFSEGDPETPAKLVSSDSSTGAIPVVKPFNFGRDPGGPEDKTMSLTIPKIGVEGVPVFDTVSEDKLRDGVVHIPATGYPWQKGANVFIAGHRIGFQDTPSYYVFFRLDELREGDEIRLQNANGRTFVYKVSSRTVVGPDSVDVMNPIEDKSLVTLQTCTLPDYEERLIVQGTLVERNA